MSEVKDRIYRYEPLWGSWKIDELLGKGSFGRVYRVSKEEMGYKYVSAVKIITVPSEEQFREAEATLDNDESTLNAYFEDVVKNIVKEINMLYIFKGNSNIISYEDHLVVKHEDGFGWDILIRTECATSLNKYIAKKQFSREEIVRIGMDICTALEQCEREGIIHRDIKDENIFVTDKGMFKLGDFGIARELSKSGRAASMRGTPLYMAPEVFRGEKYDNTADIYSLGIVLYRLLNKGRIPFMPTYPIEIKFKDSEDALDRRMAGETLTLPVSAFGKFGEIVLKACSFKPEDRFRSCSEMKKELEAALREMSEDEKSELVTIVKSKESNTGKGNLVSSAASSLSGSNDRTVVTNINDNKSAAEPEKEPKEYADDLEGTISIFNNNDFGKKIEESKNDDEINKTVSIFIPDNRSKAGVQNIQESANAKQVFEGNKNNQTKNVEPDGLSKKPKNRFDKRTLIIAAALICVLLVSGVSIAAKVLNGKNQEAGMSALESSTTNEKQQSTIVDNVDDTNEAVEQEATNNVTTKVKQEAPTQKEVKQEATKQEETKPVATPEPKQKSKEAEDTRVTKETEIRKSETVESQTKKPENKVSEVKTENSTSTAKSIQENKTTVTVQKTPEPKKTQPAIINDFRIKVARSSSNYTITVTSPKDGQRYYYSFYAQEDNSDDTEPIGTGVSNSSGTFTINWAPTKKDTYYVVIVRITGNGLRNKIEG